MEYYFKFCPLCKYPLRWAKIDNKKRLVCQGCGWINYKNPLPVVASAVINKENKILIIRRNLEPGMNKWALPGGFIELGETPEEAAVRELKEETGIDSNIIHLIGVYLQKSKRYGSLLIIGYLATAIHGNISVNSEVKEAKFFSKEEIPYIPFSTHRKIVKEAYKNLEYINW